MDEEVLLAQIDLLAAQAELYNLNSDLQLLLGYHMIGIGEPQEAVKPLIKRAPAWSTAQHLRYCFTLRKNSWTKIKPAESISKSERRNEKAVCKFYIDRIDCFIDRYGR